MMKLLLNLFVIVALSLVVACESRPKSDPVERHDLFGKYVATASFGSRDELSLKADGKYVRNYTGPRGDRHSDAGSWELRYSDPDDLTQAQVALSDFRLRRQSVPGSFSYSGADKAVLGTVPQLRLMNVFVSGSADNKVVRFEESNGNAWVKREKHSPK